MLLNPCRPRQSARSSRRLGSKSRRSVHQVWAVSCVHSHLLRHVRRVGQMLTRYKSGPLPKPFKIIPSLPQWSRILALTHPENWSPQACHAATRIFISQMKPPQARLFLEVVLLDAIREDIRLTCEGARKNKNHRKLNVHYYESLKRAMYKPGAVFKGIVFPLLSVCRSSCLWKRILNQRRT